MSAEFVCKIAPGVFLLLFVSGAGEEFPVGLAEFVFAIRENFFVCSYEDFIRVSANPKLFRVVYSFKTRFQAQG